ncbi:hypothetical protein BDK51DRAFT_41932 [Blyttiomyces helicus]|uniref:Uncharacterized protein n=1 Tax=Blyttiomyces helicus TaxID=388810 RepID=A0A4P9W167_9FUNG|nr:hypothetical protein BDK51DRAFT_41932 [Blyttiomyces helicus]|eukprot:RKO85382.1 hypothetical protein BDK51DRAFT_41932 [Blyttiomyces helicus]
MKKHEYPSPPIKTQVTQTNVVSLHKLLASVSGRARRRVPAAPLQSLVKLSQSDPGSDRRWLQASILSLEAKAAPCPGDRAQGAVRRTGFRERLKEGVDDFGSLQALHLRFTDEQSLITHVECHASAGADVTARREKSKKTGRTNNFQDDAAEDWGGQGRDYPRGPRRDSARHRAQLPRSPRRGGGLCGLCAPAAGGSCFRFLEK